MWMIIANVGGKCDISFFVKVCYLWSKLDSIFQNHIGHLMMITQNILYSEAPRAKRASGAPWVNKSTHPRKFGNHVTDRPSVRTTGIPMFTLTLSSYFGSPGESWLHINVVINWQLSKQGIRWPVSPDRIAGSGVDPSRSSIFWSYPLTIYSFSNDRRLTFTYFFKFISNMLCLCQYRLALLRFWFQTDLRRNNSASFFLNTGGEDLFLPWSQSTSNFYALIG